jgi:hypothetical protein
MRSKSTAKDSQIADEKISSNRTQRAAVAVFLPSQQNSQIFVTAKIMISYLLTSILF